MASDDLRPRIPARLPMAGFTLVELMVVVAILGIIAAIAYPSYTGYLVKTRRSAAATCLQQNAQFMERYYTTNLTYAGATAPGSCDPDLNTYYTFSAANLGAKTYTLTATPTARQNDAKCNVLSLDATGQRSRTGNSANVSECW